MFTEVSTIRRLIAIVAMRLGLPVFALQHWAKDGATRSDASARPATINCFVFSRS
jgi:hypothetical protein